MLYYLPVTRPVIINFLLIKDFSDERTKQSSGDLSVSLCTLLLWALDWWQSQAGWTDQDYYFLVSSSLDKVLMISSFLAWRRSSLRLRASFVLERRASAWSLWETETAVHICASCFLSSTNTLSTWTHLDFSTGSVCVCVCVDLRQELLAGLVCLQLVNVLHKDALVLEHVTLGPQVEAVVPGRGNRAGKEVRGHQSHWTQFKWLLTRRSWTYMCLSIFLDSL